MTAVGPAQNATTLARFPGTYARDYGPDLGLSLHAGYGRQLGRLGLRFGVAYYERSRAYNDFTPPHGPALPDYSHVTSSSTVAGMFDLTYDWTRTRVRPYLIGGVGVYRTSVWTRFDSTTTAPTHGAYYGVILSPGLGLRLPFGKNEAFAETRFLFGSGASHVLFPVTFGIRF